MPWSGSLRCSWPCCRLLSAWSCCWSPPVRIAGRGLVKSHSLHCNERARSSSAVSTTWRLVFPVLVVIRSRLAAAFGESITCNLVNNVPSGSLSARSLYRFCRSAVLIGPISRPPFRYSVTGEGAGRQRLQKKIPRQVIPAGVGDDRLKTQSVPKTLDGPVPALPFLLRRKTRGAVLLRQTATLGP